MPENQPNLTPVLGIIAAICWVSAIALFLIGMGTNHLRFLMWASIPDALVATVLTVVVVKRWALK